MPRVLISAGDVSGDLHAAGFALALRERIPDIRMFGLGGEALRKAGVELVADQSDLAIGGLFELVGSFGRVLRAWRRMTAAVAQHHPDLVVLVDSGGFNLPLARHVRHVCAARVLYYVPPQVWAWRPGRVRKLVHRVDRVAVIHPFESDFYADVALPVDFVGHPLVDELDLLRVACDRVEACRRAGLDPEKRWVALLPGSRRNEVDRHLPLMLEAARRLHGRVPDVGFVLALAPTVLQADIEARVDARRLPTSLSLVIVRGRTREAIRAADVVLTKPGTATVEAMLLERPMVVVGRAHPLTELVVRSLIQVPWLAMPNLISRRTIVPELLQREATPKRVAESVFTLLGEEAANAQRRDLARAARRLGPGGAADRASAIAEEMLGSLAT